MITTRRLTRIFRTDEVETTALHEITLVIAAGEFVAVTGPSGCGKSTLLNVLGLLDRPTAGSYRFMGEEVARLPERRRVELRRRGIGFVFQSFNLIDELTIRENVALPLLYQHIAAGERRKRVDALLERFDLAARGNHRPRQLSGGQQQRAAVARALVMRPSLILADEPTGNLDSAHGSEVMDTLARLNAEGTTIVMVTHAPEYAARAGRIVRLLDGHVVAGPLLAGPSLAGPLAAGPPVDARRPEGAVGCGRGPGREAP
jgi:putative ABC transport system ATP-binding protein